MKIKYDAVFGDQLLFGDDRSNATVVVSFDDGAKVFIDPDKYRVATPLFGYNGSFSIAMRRIIPEPKRWTWEDKKAGRLPEVGCIVEYFKNNEHDDTEVTAQWCNGDKLEILRHQNKYKAFVVFNTRTEKSGDLIVQCMKPIESPEEKAARLEDEWIESNANKLPQLNWCDWRRLYKALLSGDLPVPAKE